jgi:hypothetical protein
LGFDLPPRKGMHDENKRCMGTDPGTKVRMQEWFLSREAGG